MNKSVEKFYSLLMDDPKELNKIRKELEEVRNEEDLMNLIDSKIIPLAREKDFDINKEDLISYEREAISRLSERELLNVSGGISLQNRKIASLLLAGISFTSSMHQGTYAMRSSVTAQSSNQNMINQDQANQYEERPDAIKKFIINQDEVKNDNFKIPDSVEEVHIEDWAFYGSPVTNFEIPESVKKLTIGDSAFKGSELESFDMPEGVELSIGKNAFSNCKKLRNINMPFGATEIGDEAFAGSGIDYIAIPSSVTNIGIRAFAFCENLYMVEFPEMNDDSVEKYKLPSLTIEDEAFVKSGIERIGIPERATIVGKRAFAQCPNLEKVVLDERENTRLFIDDGAFAECRKLTEVMSVNEGNEMGKGSIYIGEKTFNNCDKLYRVSVNCNRIHFSEEAFNGCESLYSVNAPMEEGYLGTYEMYKAFKGTPFGKFTL